LKKYDFNSQAKVGAVHKVKIFVCLSLPAAVGLSKAHFRSLSHFDKRSTELTPKSECDALSDLLDNPHFSGIAAVFDIFQDFCYNVRNDYEGV
jgi:hypothetical protein